MRDCFELIGLPRRPWLEGKDLKERLHRLTGEHHPDVAGGSGDRLQEINGAYSILREPRNRITHLLELEGLEIEPKGNSVPPAIAKAFMDTGTVLQGLERFLAKEEKAVSPIARAALAGEKFEAIDLVESQIAELAGAESALLDELKTIDAKWEDGKVEAAPRLAEIADSLAFFGKWMAQLREGLFKLSL